MAIPSVLGEPILTPMLILLAFIWLLPHTPLPDRVHSTVQQQYQQLPKVKVDLHPQRTFQNRYSRNKTALYIEPRATIKHLTPLLVRMMEVVPPEWRFVFLGTEDTHDVARHSGTIRRYEEWGKLQFRNIERWALDWGARWDEIGVDEMSNRLLTNVSFFGEELPGVEHLFVFQSDSVLCANSEADLNDWLQYDWVGAPWDNGARFGGNGGLSLRKVSKMLEVLQFQKPYQGEFHEDQWMAARVGLLPGAKMASPELERGFAVESLWYDRPMGYHLNPAGLRGEVWDEVHRRKHIFSYCPEIKIIMDMRLERERCPAPPTPAPRPPPPRPPPEDEDLLSDVDDEETLENDPVATAEDDVENGESSTKAKGRSVTAVLTDHKGDPVPEQYQ